MDIKIFVSHRIDKKSETINNPLFYPVRCGAIYDKNESDIAGDNIGDNISEKRMQYCEFTVQYWAWKNVKADYYGFCHYRRYLSFSDQKYSENSFGCVEYPYIDDTAVEKFCIDEKTMRDKVEKYDIITSVPINVKQSGNYSSVYNYCEKLSNSYNIEDVDLLIKIIEQKYPEYSKDTHEFFTSKYNRWYNCYIMKKDIFFNYCEWLFDILSEFERQVNIENYNEEKTRIVGVMGERLFGIYYNHLLKTEQVKTCELQLVYFKDTRKVETFSPYYNINNIPIVFVCNDYYAPFCVTAIQSIINNSSLEYNYDIIILSSDITDSNEKIIKDTAHAYQNINIRISNISKIIYHYAKISPNVLKHFSMYKFAVQDVLSDYEKIIFLDCDVIVKMDIAKLYQVSVKDVLLAATIDPDFIAQYCGGNSVIKPYCEDTLRIKNPYTYFQTGVVVLNLDRFKENLPAGKIMKDYDIDNYLNPFQDILNMRCEEQVRFINMNWNVMTDGNWNRINRISMFAPLRIKNQYMEGRDSPHLLHYTGGIKPWQNPYVDFAYEFWMIARNTPYYEKMLYLMGKDSTNKKRWLISKLKNATHRFADLAFPKGTNKRVYIKKFYYRLRGWS